jgi:hypothetical protein
MPGNIDAILEGIGIARDIRRVGVTCVDPDYPAVVLGDSFDGVSYTAAGHAYGGHVQQVADGLVQVSLVYRNGHFEVLSQDNVHKNLGNGVIQLAYSADENALVFGVPGDVLAFSGDPVGSIESFGFAFGNPDRAPPTAARDLLLYLVANYSQHPVEDVGVSVMAHPDCGQFAATAFVHDKDRYIGAVKQLAESEVAAAGLEIFTQRDVHKLTGGSYRPSVFADVEGGAKAAAWGDLCDALAEVGVTPQHRRLIVPGYSPRVPGVLKQYAARMNQ